MARMPEPHRTTHLAQIVRSGGTMQRGAAGSNQSINAEMPICRLLPGGSMSKNNLDGSSGMRHVLSQCIPEQLLGKSVLAQIDNRFLQ